MKSRKVKWYSPSMMRRAGHPRFVLRAGLVGMHLHENGKLQLVAYADAFGITRDGQAVPKEFARATASIPAHRLVLCAGIARKDAGSLVASMQSNLDAFERTIRSVIPDNMSRLEIEERMARYV